MPRRPIAGLIARLATVALAFILAGSFPAAAQDDPRDREIALLKKRALALRQQRAVDQVEIDRLRQEITELREALDSRTSGRRPVAEPEPIGPAMTPHPAIETTDLDVAPVVPETPAREPSHPASADLGADDLQAVYDDGYTLFHQKRYAESEARFASFLARVGDSDLADNAQFWIGECRYARGELSAALEAFTTVVERYPKGNKVPDAMVKAGKSLEGMGDPDAARTTYREVQARFPGTAAAATAAELLARLQ